MAKFYIFKHLSFDSILSDFCAFVDSTYIISHHSKKKIFPSDFEYGKKYTIYFDELTKIIVRVEVVDSA